jgi:hypothetical protein
MVARESTRIFSPLFIPIERTPPWNVPNTQDRPAHDEVGNDAVRTDGQTA